MTSVVAMNAAIGDLKQQALETLQQKLSDTSLEAGDRTAAILDAEDVLQAMIAMADTVKQKGYKYS
jgi:hypothetical protein